MERQKAKQPKRVLATVLFTDIVGSTKVAEEMGDVRWRELLGRHHQIVRRELKRFGGRELDTAGDGFFASFDQPANAIRFASSTSEALQTLGIDIRAGVHVGECEQIGSKLGGIAVHVGSRVMGHAGAAEIVVSGTTRDLAQGAGVTFEDRGVHPLKGIEGEWHLWSVTALDETERPAPLEQDEAVRRRAGIAPPPLLQRRWPRMALAGAALGVIGLLAYFLLAPGGGSLDAIPPDNVGVIDPDSGKIRDVFPVGTGLGEVVATGDAAWVARSGAGIVSKIDRATGRAEPISVRGQPTALAVGSEGRVWVLSAFDGILQRISSSGGQVDRREESLSGTRDLVVGVGSVWVTRSDGSIQIFDERADAQTAIALPDGTQPTDIAFGAGSLWVVDDDAVLRVDPVTRKLDGDRIDLNFVGDDIAAGPSGVWVIHQAADKVTRIDPESGDTFVTDVGDAPMSIAVDETGAWVANGGSGDLSHVSASSGSVDQTVAVGSQPVSVSAAGGWIWVSVQR